MSRWDAMRCGFRRVSYFFRSSVGDPRGGNPVARAVPVRVTALPSSVGSVVNSSRNSPLRTLPKPGTIAENPPKVFEPDEASFVRTLARSLAGWVVLLLEVRRASCHPLCGAV